MICTISVSNFLQKYYEQETKETEKKELIVLPLFDTQASKPVG